MVPKIPITIRTPNNKMAESLKNSRRKKSGNKNDRRRENSNPITPSKTAKNTYAGANFQNSPLPSSLPIPVFPYQSQSQPESYSSPELQYEELKPNYSPVSHNRMYNSDNVMFQIDVETSAEPTLNELSRNLKKLLGI